jgi:hypothetical protein
MSTRNYISFPSYYPEIMDNVLKANGEEFTTHQPIYRRNLYKLDNMIDIKVNNIKLFKARIIERTPIGDKLRLRLRREE